MSQKRAYKTASVEPSQNGFGVFLDKRQVRTPKRNPLVVPTRPLAEALCEEWEAQTEQIAPATMPLNRLVYSSIDLIREQHVIVASELATYGQTDLLCYRAEGPEELMRRQSEGWQPWLDWAADNLGCRLVSTHGVTAIRQDVAVLEKLKQEVLAHDSFRLAGLHQAVTLTGSLVLGLALSRGALDAAQAMALAQIDERFQIERWGEDAAAAARLRRMAQELLAVERYFGLLA